jgi:hypothetical protein
MAISGTRGSSLSERIRPRGGCTGSRAGLETGLESSRGRGPRPAFSWRGVIGIGLGRRVPFWRVNPLRIPAQGQQAIFVLRPPAGAIGGWMYIKLNAA